MLRGSCSLLVANSWIKKWIKKVANEIAHEKEKTDDDRQAHDGNVIEPLK